MKRYLLTLTTMLAAVISTAAQGIWTAPAPNQYNDETVVYATVSINGAEAGASDGDLMVAAFIGGQCRAIAADAQTGPGGQTLFVLRVGGDRQEDHGLTIDFGVKMKDDAAGIVVQAVVPGERIVFDGESHGKPSLPIVLSVSAVERVPLQGLIATWDPFVAGHPVPLRLSPVPADATFDPYALSLDFDINETFSQWPVVSYTLSSAEPVVFDVTFAVHTDASVSVSLDGQVVPVYSEREGGFASLFWMNANYALNLHTGWQWRANPVGSYLVDDFIEAAYGPDLIELRTHEFLLYNDPEWGYYGTLLAPDSPGLMPFTAYKVKMKTDTEIVLTNIDLPMITYNYTLKPGWNWIPSHTYFDRTPANAWPAAQNAALPAGTVIVTKEDGTVEWNGTEWVGDLQTVRAGDSFLAYNPDDETDAVLHYVYEARDLPMGPDAVAATSRAGNAPALTPASGFAVLPATAARYRDNMSAVITVEGYPLADDLLIGAFAPDGECRGVGRTVRGLLFLTVHADSGEQLQLRLRRQSTGAEYAIDEPLTVSGLRQGSLRQPLILHSPEAVQGIAEVRSGLAETRCYDLLGRRQNASQHYAPTSHPNKTGLVIRRNADGTTTKILSRSKTNVR